MQQPPIAACSDRGLAETPMLSASATERFWMSLVVSVPVVSLFLLASIAAWELAITAPFKSVLPLTMISKPPSSASSALCSCTLA